MKKCCALLALCLLLAGCAAADTLSAAPGQALAYSYRGEVTLTLNGEAAQSLSADEWQRGLLPLPEGGELAFTGDVQNLALVEEAEAQAILAAGQDMGVYAVSVTDEAGNPLSGAMVQVCDAASCRLEQTDETGLILLTLPRFAYEVHMLRAPVGYQLPQEAVLLPEEGGRWAIVLQKAN